MLTGGAGADTMTGGRGADRFVWGDAGEGRFFDLLDTVTDFNAGRGDSLDFSPFLSLGGGAAGDFVQLAVAGKDTTVLVDPDGQSGAASFAPVVLLEGTSGLDVEEMVAENSLVFAV